MKSLTFSEFFDLPPGVIFGQDYALPHRDPGLWLKGISWWPEEDEEPTISIVDLTYEGDHISEVISEWGRDPDHRFLVYEAGDLGRLAGIIKDARKVAI